jgi:predicted alpha/beta-fold hydrolase
MSILNLFLQIVHYFFVAFLFLGLKLFGYISFTHMVAAYIIYCIYVQYSSKTKLYYTKNAKNDKILSMCPELSNPNFKPHFFLPFAFQQMILSEVPLLISNKPKVSFREQKVNDYGVNLYWPYFTDIKEISDPNTPILFFCPGMTGEITDPYVINICIEGLKNGYHVCVYQMRILSENFGVDESGKMNFSEDIDLCLDYIKNDYPNAKIYGISGSFGANNLLYYLGEKNKNLPKNQKKIEAAVSFSNPYNMEICSRLCEGTIISSLVTYLERKNSLKIKDSIEKCPNLSYMNTQQLIECENPYLFDEIFNGRLHGYKNATEYYREISAVKTLANIDIPVLCINSTDDPITPYQAIAYDDIKLNPNIFLIVTDKGAHMAFISNEKLTELKQWNLKPAFEFLNCQRGFEL